MKRFYLSKLIFVFVALLGNNVIAFAQTTTSYSIPGTYSYTVAPGVVALSIDMAGAQGGTSLSSQGGKGGRVQGTLAVTGGQILQVNVGGAGTNYQYCVSRPGGTNGGGNGYGYGGGGGGASDIRNGGTSLGNRVMVAGGGGGAGYNCGTTNGEYGGDGGGSTGSTGAECNSVTNCYCGAGGSQTSGGAGATCYGSPSGSFGQGANATGSQCYSGGGGGGYYGGGSGAYGGGGGGSSYFTNPAVTGGTSTAGFQSGNGYVSITQLCNPPGTISGSAPICIGATVTLSETVSGGTWISSNTSIATVNSSGVVTGISAGTATITYSVSSPCGTSATTTVTVNPLPPPNGGLTSICNGFSTTITNSVTGGSWSSSNPALASINSSTGFLSAAGVGTATITYTLPTGCLVTSSFTVFGAPPAITVPGTGAVCVGSAMTLSDATTGGSWTCSSTSIATVGAGTGTVTGVSAGVDTIFYTLPTGCATSATITVNPLPASIAGLSNVCIGGTTTLTDATSGGTWSISNPGLASINAGTGLVLGIVAGSATVTYTLGATGCRATVPLVINSLPASITGSPAVCVGANITLSDATSGGTWGSSNPLIASIGAGTGIVTGASPGFTSITYTLVTGCSTTTSILVNPLPAAFAVTGGGSYCASGVGVHVGLAFSNSGVSYQLFQGGSPVGSAIPGSSAGLDFGLQTSAGTYTAKGTNLSTGCVSTMTGSAVVSIYAAPSLHNVTGGGGYCAGSAGVSVGLDGSNTGIKYQLYDNGTPVGGLVSGTGLPLVFGTFTATGTYTVIATNTSTGCTTTMSGSTVVSINPLPTPYTVSGGGNYCAGTGGVHILLLNSDAGNTYNVMYSGGIVGTRVSVGGYIDFGPFTSAGTYTVVGVDGSTFCSNPMSGSATIVINPQPVAYTVTPTAPAAYCIGGAGVHVGLSYSAPGVNYSLWYGGVPLDTIAGSGSGLDFGAQTNTGSYTVVATNVTTQCTAAMSGAANITVNSLPFAYSVTGGGTYCTGTSGVNIGTSGSDFGVNYQLFRGTTPIGLPVAGNGTGLSFGAFSTPGTYTVVATGVYTGCVKLQSGSASITVTALPNIYTVTGGGYFCAGDTGVHVRLSGSQAGVTYQLFLGGVPTGTLVAGTGTALDFGLQTGPGVYTAVGTNGVGCLSNMSGSASIIVNPLPTLYNVTGGGPYCAGGTGVHIGLDGSNSGISYQLYNGAPVGTPLSGSGLALDFGLKTVIGTYTVKARNVVTGCLDTMNLNAIVSTNPLPVAYTFSGGGNECSDGLGFDLSLPNSDLGTNYQLLHAGVPTGGVLAGVGGLLDFGTQTAPGTYTVLATDATTGCSAVMPGSAHIGVVIPAVFAVTGGGSYCAGGTGALVGLGGSAVTEKYQLFTDTGPVDTLVPGTGSSLNFGLQTHTGPYFVVATNTSYGCTDTMAGTATVSTNALPVVNTMTGGGSYCAGGTGVHVSLSGSSTGIYYQLFRGSTATGSPVAGTGSPLDFGLHTAAGAYTVVATNTGTGCADTMSGTSVVNIHPLPFPYVVGIENDGFYCASDTSGVHIYLGGSDTLVSYKLWRGTTAVDSAAGIGGTIDFGKQLVAGSYIVTGVDTDPIGCANTMSGTVTVSIMPLPTVHNVTGGGNFCPGQPGVHIGLDGSDLGIRYTIRKMGFPNDTSSIWGSGTPLDFGIYDSSGTYTATGISHHLLTGCANDMFGSAVVAYDTILTPIVALRAYPGTGVSVYHIDSMHAFVNNGGSNPTYQWIINGHVIPGATNPSFTHYEFFNMDSVACVVTASGICGGNTTSKYLIITLHDVQVTTVTSGTGDVRLIPNPNKGAFTIKGSLGTSTDEEVTLEVTNMLGQVMYSAKSVAQGGNLDQHIQLSNVANGMYILNLQSGSQHAVFHFVVEQ